jgi:hypothetical protein
MGTVLQMADRTGLVGKYFRRGKVEENNSRYGKRYAKGAEFEHGQAIVAETDAEIADDDWGVIDESRGNAHGKQNDDQGQLVISVGHLKDSSPEEFDASGTHHSL